MSAVVRPTSHRPTAGERRVVCRVHPA